jgi:hypothetical protein
LVEHELFAQEQNLSGQRGLGAHHCWYKCQRLAQKVRSYRKESEDCLERRHAFGRIARPIREGKANSRPHCAYHSPSRNRLMCLNIFAPMRFLRPTTVRLVLAYPLL